MSLSSIFTNFSHSNSSTAITTAERRKCPIRWTIICPYYILSLKLLKYGSKWEPAARLLLISQCTRLYDVPGTHNVSQSSQYRYNVGSTSQPIVVSMPVNRIRCWPNIEKELGDCPGVCSDCHTSALTLYLPESHYGTLITWYIGPSVK